MPTSAAYHEAVVADPALPQGAIEQAETAWAEGRAAEASALFGDAIADARARADVHGWTRAVLGLAATQRFGPDPGRLPALLAEALAAQPGAADRVRLLAALARSWVYAGTAGRAVRFADEALALARTEGEPGALADALDAALTSHWGPDELGRRRDLAAQLDEVAAHLLGADARLQAHLWGFTVAFEQLDVLALNRQVRALELLGEDCPKARFFAASRRLALDLMRGRLDTASTLLGIATQAAEEARLPDAPVVVLALRSYVALYTRDASACAEAAAAAEAVADAEGLTTVVAEAAPFWVAAGRPDRALALLHRFDGPALAAVPRDQDWLLVMQCLLEVAVATGERDAVAAIVRLLAPFTGRAVVNAGGFMFHGVTDDPLARAYTLLGDDVVAGELRASALVRYERTGAHWWYARLAKGSDAPEPRELSPWFSAVLRPVPGGWEVGDPQRPALLPELRGLAHLHRLVGSAGRPIAALDLVGAPSGGAVVIEPGLGPALDATAARAYRARLHELDDELAEARDWADAGRIERVVAEKDALLAELHSAFGLAGRPRDQHSSTERSRVAVRKAIAAALERLDAVEPGVAAHLRAHVHTGHKCVYEPEPGLGWTWTLE